MSYFDNMRSCTQNLIDIDTFLINEANYLINEIETHQRTLRMIKIYDVTLGTLGTAASIAGICLLPDTGRSSSILVASGALLTAGSAGSQMITDFKDYDQSKNFLEIIKKLLEEHDAVATKFQNMIKDVQDIVQILKQQHNLDENIPITNILAHVINGAGQVTVIVKAETIPNIAMTRDVLESTNNVLIRNTDADTSMSFNLGKPLTEMSKSEMNGIMQIIKTSKAAAKVILSIGKNSIPISDAVVGIAITLWDVYTLVNEWNKDHPIIENITNLRDNLTIEKESLERLLKPENDMIESFCYHL
jgi:hypothetical protein